MTTDATKAKGSIFPRFDTFRRVDVGAGFALLSLCLGFIGTEATDVGFALTALYMLVFLSRRPKEEFARACWYRGCSTVFVALLLWMIVVPFIGGFIDGFLSAGDAAKSAANSGILPPENRPPSPYEAQIKGVIERIQPLSLFAFFLGFQWQRFRGDPE